MARPGGAYASVSVRVALRAWWDEANQAIFIGDDRRGVSIIIDPADAELLAAELAVAAGEASNTVPGRNT